MLSAHRAAAPAGRSVVFVSHHDRNLYRFRLPIMMHLVESGVTVYAVCPAGEVAHRFADHGIRHVEFPVDRLTFSPFRAARTIRRLHQILDGLRPAIIHSFTLRPNLYVNLAALGLRSVVLNSVTGLGSLYAGDGGARRAALRTLVNAATRLATRWRANVVIFQNPDDRRYYRRHRLCRESQARLIAGSGVDISEFSCARFDTETGVRLRHSWGIARDATLVTMIARLISSKGVGEFLEAAMQLKDRATFVLIGAPDPGNPDRLPDEEIDCAVSEAGVIRTGRQDNIPEWLCASDVYVLPSYREGLPRTVLEAMAMELPIVTTDVPGCRETVTDGENGFLVPVRDARSLAEAIDKLLSDRGKRREMGRRSREIVESRFRIEGVVEEHVSLYAEMIRGAGV